MHLLSTKFYIPPVSASLVSRPRLEQRFQTALEKPLTLIAAPAGSGKTTLLAEWAHMLRAGEAPGQAQPGAAASGCIAASGCSVAWLSLEPADNTPARFWMYIVAALKGALSTPCGHFDELMDLLQPGVPFDLEPVIDAIINTVDAASQLCVLVLDDYHAIQNVQVHESLAYWVERQPPLLHLVIATRTDPPLPIHRLRARGKLNELRAADLRFSLAEAEELLRRISGVELLPEDVAALEKTTEGWAAGLQMAALALQAQFSALPAISPSPDRIHDPIRKWIAGFSGQHYYILDYLAEEVFNHQPEHMQDFLLRTAILEEMCAELCEYVIRDSIIRDPVIRDSLFVIRDAGETAVSSQTTNDESRINESRITESRIPSSSQSILETLDRSNLFLIPLDSQRKWYRYHHLFADLLRARLMQQPAEWVAGLHARASAWYEQNERAAEAVRHALAARDWQRAARLVERNWRQPVEQGEVGLALQWLDGLPEETVRKSPLLNFAYCWIFWLTGQISRMAPRLEVVLQALQEASLAQQPELVALWCQAPMIQAIIQRQKGDLPAAIQSAREAVERAGALPDTPDAEQKALQLGVAYYQQAETYRFAGDLENAARSFSLALPLLRSRSLMAYTSACLILSQIQRAQGQLRQARETCQAGLAFIGTQPNPRLPLYASLHIAAAEVQCEQNDLEEAALHLERALDLGRGQMNILRQGAYVALRLGRARHALADALPLLAEAERAVRKVEAPYLAAEVAAVQAKIHIELGDLAQASGWATQAGFPAGLEHAHTYQPVELLTYARLLCARGDLAQAIPLLDRLLAEAETAGMWGSALEMLLLRAAARQQRGDRTGALGDVERALALAEPEGYLRVFADAGQPAARLLAAVQKRLAQSNAAHPAFSASGSAFSAAYLARVLAAFPRPVDGQEVQPDEEMPAPQTQAEPAALVEPLTEREMDVLRLLALGLSNREMAEKLVVSEGTIKTHVHNLIAKLGAQSRTHAIALARQMKLI